MRLRLAAALLVVAAANPAGLAAAAGPSRPNAQAAQVLLADGENPYPIKLQRPPSAPLSAMALVGQKIFFDSSLSSSGKLACASCHIPGRAYGPPGAAPAVLGGENMQRQGVRAVPSLMYLERQPAFAVGPDDEENENTSLAQMVAQATTTARPQKVAGDSAPSATALVPQGGLFWDGRVDSLQDQALVPLLNPLEMDGGSVAVLAAKLRRAAYAPALAQLFGPQILDNPDMLVSEALFAVGRYQIEAIDFHPYTSKYDYWLEGKARLTPTEIRGFNLFNDPDKANCAGCHLDQPAADGTPPLFTDHQFEALGAPRNMELAANQDPAYFDRGICGPYRGDMAAQTQYCGMFLTPTLRNAATRQVFFHNGVFHTLQQVMDFYAFRDVAPEKVYPRNPDGTVAKYNDSPPADRANIDVADAPFDRSFGDQPAMTPQEEQDIIAFLGTLTDGYAAPSVARR